MRLLPDRFEYYRRVGIFDRVLRGAVVISDVESISVGADAGFVPLILLFFSFALTFSLYMLSFSCFFLLRLLYLSIILIVCLPLCICTSLFVFYISFAWL